MAGKKTLGDMVNAIVACGNQLRTCMVDAVVIDDKNKRIDAALKCITKHDDCQTKAVSTERRRRRDPEVERLVRKLRKNR